MIFYLGTGKISIKHDLLMLKNVNNILIESGTKSIASQTHLKYCIVNLLSIANKITNDRCTKFY